MASKGKSADFDYAKARATLARIFAEAESLFAERREPPASDPIKKAFTALFASATQSYREVLIGCVLVRFIAPHLDIRLPYMNLGENAYSGRQIDENVVNPFLHEHQVPSSKGPYLATFRRSVSFTPELLGQKDKSGYGTFLEVIAALERAKTDAECKAILLGLLYRFVALRDASVVSLQKVKRLGLDQFRELIGLLLASPSGGLMPVLLTVAMFHTIRDQFSQPWQIEFQGINVADKARGASGDVTILRDGAVVMAIEVTERPIDRARVVATFHSKISSQGIADYLFLTGNAGPDEEAKVTARQYSA